MAQLPQQGVAQTTKKKPGLSLDTLLERVGVRDKPDRLLENMRNFVDDKDWDKLHRMAQGFCEIYETQQQRIQSDPDFIDSFDLIANLAGIALPATILEPKVQTQILGVISLLSRHPSNEAQCIAHVDRIITALAKHADDKMLQRKGMRILAQLGDSDAGLDSIVATEIDVMPHLLHAMKFFLTDKPVQQAALCTLSALADLTLTPATLGESAANLAVGQGQQTLCSLESLLTVTKAMCAHLTDRTVQYHALAILGSVAATKEGKVIVIRAGAVQYAILAMQQHVSDQEIQLEALTMLDYIAGGGDAGLPSAAATYNQQQSQNEGSKQQQNKINNSSGGSSSTNDYSREKNSISGALSDDASIQFFSDTQSETETEAESSDISSAAADSNIQRNGSAASGTAAPITTIETQDDIGARHTAQLAMPLSVSLAAVVPQTLAAMKAHKLDQEVQLYGLTLLLGLATTTTHNATSTTSNTVAGVSAGVNSGSTAVAATTTGGHTTVPVVGGAGLESLVAAGTVPLTAEAMRAHVGDQEVQLNALLIFWRLSACSEGRRALVQSGAVALVVGAMGSNRSAREVQTKAMVVLWRVALTAEGRDVLVSAEAVQLVVQVAAEYETDADVQVEALGFFFNMQAELDLLLDHGMQARLVGALLNHPHHQEVQAASFELLELVISASPEAADRMYSNAAVIIKAAFQNLSENRAGAGTAITNGDTATSAAHAAAAQTATATTHTRCASQETLSFLLQFAQCSPKHALSEILHGDMWLLLGRPQMALEPTASSSGNAFDHHLNGTPAPEYCVLRRALCRSAGFTELSAMMLIAADRMLVEGKIGPAQIRPCLAYLYLAEKAHLQANFNRYGCLGCLTCLLAHSEGSRRTDGARALEHVVRLLELRLVPSASTAVSEDLEGVNSNSNSNSSSNSNQQHVCIRASPLHSFGQLLDTSEGKALSDCTFLVGPTKEAIHAHTALLVSSNCTVAFATLAPGSGKSGSGSGKGIAEVPGASPSSFTLLLKYLYTGEVDCEDAEVLELMQLAERYAVRPLQQQLVERVIERLSIDSLDTLWEALDLSMGCIGSSDANSDFGVGVEVGVGDLVGRSTSKSNDTNLSLSDSDGSLISPSKSPPRPAAEVTSAGDDSVAVSNAVMGGVGDTTAATGTAEVVERQESQEQQHFDRDTVALAGSESQQKFVEAKAAARRIAEAIQAACACFMMQHIQRVVTEDYYMKNRRALAALIECELAAQISASSISELTL